MASIRAGFLGLVECRWTQEENKRGADHSGSSFDSFLEEEEIREEVEAVAIKRLVAWQLKTAMRKQQKKKEAMANLLRRD